jgi:hypothetical protein
MSKNQVAGVTNAAAAGGAVASAVAVGGATSAGFAVAKIIRHLKAGEEGWDVSGNFVCSEFVFNFRTMQVFDGSEVHDVSDITEVGYNNGVVLLTLKGRVKPKEVVVQLDKRCRVICKMISDMWEGVSYKPDTKALLPKFRERVHRLTPSHVCRYAVRALVIGGTLGAFLSSQTGRGDATEYWVGGLILAVFAMSVFVRKIRHVEPPKWKV